VTRPLRPALSLVHQEATLEAPIGW